MADNLNKTRMRDTRILMGLTLLAGLLADTAFPAGSGGHLLMQVIGYVLLTVCAIGRIYVSTFIGGVKNEQLVTSGPYSLVRNPLYFFSLCGAAGVGFMTTSFLCLFVIVGGFYFIYDKLIAREEDFLGAKFGASFDEYKRNVPRLLPSLKGYNAPEELVFQPRYLNKAVLDAVWWFAPLPVFLLVERLKFSGAFDAPLTLF